MVFPVIAQYIGPNPDNIGDFIVFFSGRTTGFVIWSRNGGRLGEGDDYWIDITRGDIWKILGRNDIVSLAG